MGRGRAYDTLCEEEAGVLRLMIRQCRDQKGLSNQDLAAALHWRKTRVVDMLSIGRPLGRTNATKLLRAIRKTNVRGSGADARADVDKANKAIDLVLPGLGRPVLLPPALIAVRHISAVAAHLATIVSKLHPGMDKKQRAVLANDLERALKRVAPEMAYMFYQRFADSRNTKTMRWIMSGHRRQLEALGVELGGKS